MLEIVGYVGAHKRHRKTIDRSKCVECGSTKKIELSLIQGSGTLQDTTKGHYGKWYSLDPNDYRPLCASCHRRYDDHPFILKTTVKSAMAARHG